MKLNRYVIHLSYLGTHYAGWQIQDNARSVQGDLMHGLHTVLKDNIGLIVGAGRTDSGVHASSFFAHFDSCEIFDLIELTYKLNRFLSDDIVINYIKPISNQFHARFSAISRNYEYFISTVKDPFLNDRAYFFFKNLNIDVMNKGASLLIGENNFKAFSKSNQGSSICCVNLAQWEQRQQRLIFSIESDRFLYNMVRCIVGTLIDLGLEKINLNQFAEIMNSSDRSKAGMSAPAEGLYLVNIKYPKNYNLEIN